MHVKPCTNQELKLLKMFLVFPHVCSKAELKSISKCDDDDGAISAAAFHMLSHLTLKMTFRTRYYSYFTDKKTETQKNPPTSS